MTVTSPGAAAGRTPPVPLTLQHFEPLLPAEQIVLRAALAGDIAKVGYRRPVGAARELRLRAEFLSFLAQGGGIGARVAGRRLQVVGAYVIGRLDLAYAVVPMSLWLYRCTFSAAPLLEGARIEGSLSLPDCSLPGLRAEACRIDGDLALNAGCSIDGEVLLARARLGRDLNCERLHMRGNGQAARTLRRRFVADGAQIAGDVNFGDGFEIVGAVRLVGARIGGDLRASNARLTADLDESGGRGVALDLDRVQVGGSVRLDAGFSAAGQVRLQRARIGGDLDCSGAAFDAAGDASWGDNSAALLLDRARIDGSLMLSRMQGPLHGASLADARVGALLDDATTWGQHHVLDGFAYARLADGAPSDARLRLDWLGHQLSTHLAEDFRPAPWQRLIKVLRRMGHDASASAVVIGRERQLRRAGLIGLGVPGALRWCACLGHDLFGLFAGYGQRPLRLLASAAMLWLLCGAAYWAAAQDGAIAPSAALLAAQPRLATCRPECAVLPATAPTFQPFVYSLDVLVPLLDLAQRRHWAPTRGALAVEAEAGIGMPLLRLLMGFETVCGWLIGLTLLASIAGLADRERRT